MNLDLTLIAALGAKGRECRNQFLWFDPVSKVVIE